MFDGKRIRILREERRLTLRQLAKVSEITSFSYLANIERGIVSDPGINTIIKIAKGLDITIDYLINS